MVIHRFLIASLLALCTLWGMAQESQLSPRQEEELWLSVGVGGRLPKFMKDLLGEQYKKFKVSGEFGYRSADNFFAGRQLYGDASLRYKVSDLLSFGAEYRYAYRTDDADRQRLGFQAYLGHTIGRLDLGYRLTFQRAYEIPDLTRDQVRNRISVDYNFPKWKLDPEFSVEFFTDVNDPRGWNHIGTRWKLGTKWTPWKGHSFGPAIVYDRDAMVAWPVNRLIWSLDYSIALRRL